MRLPIKLLHPNAQMPTRANPTDSGLDLVILEEVWLKPLVQVAIPHGLAIQLPAGYEGQIRPRSSSLLKRGLYVSTGTIDHGYRGELNTIVMFLAPPTSKYLRLNAGDRISQLVIAPVSLPSLMLCDDLDDSARGLAGLGSSGK